VLKYDRESVLKKARRAAKRGSHAKAAALYARLRQAEPSNADILRRVAAHRTRAGLREEALRDCRVAARALARRGFVAHAISVYREYTTRFPHVEEAWRALSDLEIERGRTNDAVGVLVEAARHFEKRRRRSIGIDLLKRARGLDPTHFEAGYRLADLTWRSGHGREARRMLESLVPHVRSRRERRLLRARLFRLWPTPAAAWRWLRAS
jgi:thioredoxin-like negative regulator of GroEL